jgi:hypothetical protein
VLLGRTDWLPVLRWAALAVGVVAAAALLLPLRKLMIVAVLASVIAGGAGTAAYAAATASVAHTGSIPSSGPSGTAGMGGGPGGAAMGTTGPPSSTGSAPAGGSVAGGARGGGMGDGEAGNAELTALLKASTTKWSAAISGATSAAQLELDSGTSVIALGGWNGSDASPTLAQFQASVAAGQIHYFISGGGMGGGGGANGGTSQSSLIATWVAAHYTAKTVGSTTVYDLTAAATS